MPSMNLKTICQVEVSPSPKDRLCVILGTIGHQSSRVIQILQEQDAAARGSLGDAVQFGRWKVLEKGWWGQSQNSECKAQNRMLKTGNNGKFSALFTTF